MKKIKCQLPVLISEYNIKAFANGGERLTQASLSSQTGIAASTINRLFNNTAHRFDSQTIEKLCDFFKCNLSELICLVNE